MKIKPLNVYMSNNFHVYDIPFKWSEVHQVNSHETNYNKIFHLIDSLRTLMTRELGFKI